MPNNILITPGSASIQFSGSVANNVRLQVEQSGSVAFYGTSGSLVNIVDELSGSLMSVNDISGLPIMEVFSDDRVVMGTYNRNTFVVSGSTVTVSGSLLLSGSTNISTGGSGSGFPFSGSAVITGSLLISGSSTSSILDVYKSGSRVFNVEGSQGQLFSVTDQLSGSLMSVNDITGLPILEVFSDDRVVMGTFGKNTLVVTGSVVNITGSLLLSGSTNITGSFSVNGQTVQGLNSSYLYQLADVNDYVSGSITDGYQLAWNSGSQQWTPTAGAVAKGVTRLFISAQRSNTSAFYFNAIQLTSDSSANTSQDTAFMLTSNLVSKVNVYLRCDANTTASLQLHKNSDGQAFGSAPTASALYPAGLTGSMPVNTVRQFTFSGLTFSNYDSIHLYCKPSANGYFYGIVTIE